MKRILIAVAVALGLAAAQSDAAELKKLVVKCIEKAEATPDDVYLEFVRDGELVAMPDDGQAGTAKGNSFSMKNGTTLTLDSATLSKLGFTKSLTIRIKDKDVATEEVIGEMNLAPGDVSNTYVTKGKDVGEFEYHVDYATTK